MKERQGERKRTKIELQAKKNKDIHTESERKKQLDYVEENKGDDST